MNDSLNRILFVEPDPMQQKIFGAVLKPEERGWHLEFADCAMKAIEMNSLDPFHVVVATYTLPDNSGTGLLQFFREMNPEILRFLLIDSTEKHLIRSLISSAQQIMMKPLDLDIFTRQINRTLALQRAIQNPNILKILGNIDALPSLPRVFDELSMVLSNPNASLQDVADLIAQDIILSSKVLKLANSALFSLREPAQNINQAVPLLGSSAVSSIVFSQSVYSQFTGGAFTESDFEELNRHSLECATFASQILTTWGAKRNLIEKSVFCGIAHDLGNLVLAKFAPEKWIKIQNELKKGERTDIELEKEIIGFTHTELTAYLLSVWGFPNDQLLAIAFHHQPSKLKETEFGLLGALHIAEYCCTSKDHKTELDMQYLEDVNITREDIDSFKKNFDETGGMAA